MAEGPLRMSQRMATGAGVLLWVNEVGTGSPLILLHGVGSSGSSWLPVIRTLAARFHLIIPDQRGHGRSDKPDRGYLIENYADDLDALIARLDEAPYILGHSLGGLAAVTWAKVHPDSARAVLLEDMPPRLNADRAPQLREWADMAAMSVPDLVAHYLRENPHWSPVDAKRRAEMLTSTRPEVFRELHDRAQALPPIDMFDGLEAIRSPIELIYGDSALGGQVPAPRGRAFAELGPNFSSVFIAGASHAIHRDSTGPFLKAVLAFFGKH